ncbi:hypothetical protein ABFP25_03400 [Acinetobacter indicus]|uniref:hypothetical protein n=1 Tax=Acinetobacter indicus TaxID=756892 RepID=UPI003212F06A
MSISKLASTVILATSFATIFLFAFIFYLYGGERSVLEDALSMTASFFGGIATLVAAYIATQLFNDWRVEKNYDLENQYLSNIVIGLRDIHAELLEMQYCSKRIKETNDKLISYSYYINRPRLDIQSAVNKLKADVEIYSMLMGDNELFILLDNLLTGCKSFDHKYNQLIHKYYSDYLDELYEYFNEKEKNIPNIKDKSSFERPYVENEKRILAAQIKGIRVFFYLSALDDIAISTIESHEDLKVFCIKRLRPQE